MKVYTFKPYIPEKALEYVRDVLESGCLAGTCNRYVAKFEQMLASYLNVKHVIATSSGTSALHVALKALGVGPGDEVIVPAFTFIATAELCYTQMQFQYSWILSLTRLAWIL